MAGMPSFSHRAVGLAAALAAAAALGVALTAEHWGGIVPCALCLLERWPYRVAVLLGLIAAFLPPRPSRVVLGALALAVLADAGIAGIHVGVEYHWWPSPLPECAAPVFSGGSIAERLAHMPAVPAKPCDDPTYFIPGLPLSIAASNLIFAGLFTIAMVWASVRRVPA
jgi:disulfide bond formation protein DsbB